MDQGLCDRTPTSVILWRTGTAKRSSTLRFESVGDVPRAIGSLCETGRRRRRRVLMRTRSGRGGRRRLVLLLRALLMLDLGVVGVGRSCCDRT